MSLIKRLIMTKKRIAANQANGRRSRGPATPQGRQRIRAANIRHGFYSKAEAVALATLREKPEEFDAVIKALTGPWRHERAAEVASTHRNTRLIRRVQDPNFREVRRVTNLLLKIKRQERRMGALKHDDEKRGICF